MPVRQPGGRFISHGAVGRQQGQLGADGFNRKGAGGGGWLGQAHNGAEQGAQVAVLVCSMRGTLGPR